MFNELLLKTFPPKPGGWSRLSVKLRAADEERRRELRIWGAVAGMLIIVTALAFHRASLPPAEVRAQILQAAKFSSGVNVRDASAVEVESGQSSVKMYWIVR